MDKKNSSSGVRKFMQLSIEGFTRLSDPKPFTVVDIGRNPKNTGPKKRGRKPKVTAVVDIVSLRRQDEVVEVLDRSAEEEEEHKRGTYHTSTYQTKLSHDLGKKMSLNEFLRRSSKALNVSENTLKTWCIQYEKDNSVLVRLQLQCTGIKRGQMVGQVYKRPTRLTYPIELDEELYDWIMWAKQVGMSLARKDVRDKAYQLINPVSSDFKILTMVG